jgi:hypothetical protein
MGESDPRRQSEHRLGPGFPHKQKRPGKLPSRLLLESCLQIGSGTLLRSRLVVSLLARLALLTLPLLSLVGRLFLFAQGVHRSLRDGFPGGHNGGRCGAFQHIYDLGRGFARCGVLGTLAGFALGSRFRLLSGFA